MAQVQMNRENVKGTPKNAYSYYEALAAAGDTDTVIIPSDVQLITVTAESTATGVTVYTTTSTIDMIVAGTETWVAWPSGSVTTATTDTSYPVTAIMATQVGAGASKIHIRAQ